MSQLRDIFEDSVLAFLTAEKHEDAFEKLDSLCTQLSQIDVDDISQTVWAYQPDLLAKVASVDAREEKLAAKEMLKAKQDGTDNYSWALPDYYEQEYAFILANVPPSSLASISYVGHGAISALGSMLNENPLVKRINFYDTDIEMTQLAWKMAERFYAIQSELSYSTEDFLTRKSEEPEDGFTVVTNAPLSAFRDEKALLTSKYVFLRATTDKGALLYPSIDLSEDLHPDYEVIASHDDELYGIHSFHILRRRPEC